LQKIIGCLQLGGCSTIGGITPYTNKLLPLYKGFLVQKGSGAKIEAGAGSEE
jgi:hypothetical protein